MCDAAGDWRERAFCEKYKKNGKKMATKRFAEDCKTTNENIG
jgi:hypothetical protein